MSDGHYEGCWLIHHACAIAEIERLRGRVEWPEEPSESMLLAADEALDHETQVAMAEAIRSGWVGRASPDQNELNVIIYKAMRAAHIAHVAAKEKEGKG